MISIYSRLHRGRQFERRSAGMADALGMDPGKLAMEMVMDGSTKLIHV